MEDINLLLKIKKLFVRDDKNILFKDQKPSTIYIKNVMIILIIQIIMIIIIMIMIIYW